MKVRFSKLNSQYTLVTGEWGRGKDVVRVSVKMDSSGNGRSDIAKALEDLANEAEIRGVSGKNTACLRGGG